MMGKCVSHAGIRREVKHQHSCGYSKRHYRSAAPATLSRALEGSPLLDLPAPTAPLSYTPETLYPTPPYMFGQKY